MQPEYQWSRPGCFKCKEPIGNRDYIEVKWVGKTWGMSYNVCENCFKPAADLLDIHQEHAASAHDPTHGRNIAGITPYDPEKESLSDQPA